MVKNKKHFLLAVIFQFILMSWNYGQQSFPDIPYQGKRMYLERLDLEKGKNGKTLAVLNLVNTGKETITYKDIIAETVLLNTNQAATDKLGEFDLDDLYTSLASTKWECKPGAYLKDLSIKIFKNERKIRTEPLVDSRQKAIDKKERIAKEKLQSEEKLQREKAARIKEENRLAAIEKKKVESERKAKEKIALEENRQKEKAKRIEEERRLAAIEKKRIESERKAKEQIALEEKRQRQAADRIEKERLASINSEVDNESVNLEEPDDEMAGCSDIKIQKIEVVKQNKKVVVLNYTLVNEGNKIAALAGLQKNEDNLAIRAHLCSSEKLSRGAITLGGSFLKLEESQANLKPGEQFVGTLRLQLYKLTKFTPYLVLQIDPYQKIMECDETNNIGSINLLPGDSISSTQGN